MNAKLLLSTICIFSLTVFSIPPVEANGVTVVGEQRQWHKVQLRFEGPTLGQDWEDNPFLNYRLNVTFTQNGQTIKVPGYFAAQGDGLSKNGKQWHVNFTPPTTGRWDYSVSFRRGANVAVSLDDDAGTPTAFDGTTGRVLIRPTNKSGKDLRSAQKGRVSHIPGERYRRYEGSGKIHLGVGPGSPEDFFGFADFHGTVDHSGSPCKPNDLQTNGGDGLHRYSQHATDWNNGDPLWGVNNDKGKNIIGAVNYLAEQGMNNMYLILFTTKGDACNTYPHAEYLDFTRIDIRKLEQWQIVADHMVKKGIGMLTFFGETENEFLINGGNMGVERKLMYREIVARLGHHLDISYDIGEENENNLTQQRGMIDYLRAIIPYDGITIGVHTYPDDQDEVYGNLSGYDSSLTADLQVDDVPNSNSYVEVRARIGEGFVARMTENGHHGSTNGPDANMGCNSSDNQCHKEFRRDVLWPSFMAGADQVNAYFGYGLAHNDLDAERFDNREKMWKVMENAKLFFSRLPLQQMNPNNDVLVQGNGYVLSRPELYAVFVRDDSTARLELPESEFAFGEQIAIYEYDTFSGTYYPRQIVTIDGSLITLPHQTGNSDAAYLIIKL